MSWIILLYITLVILLLKVIHQWTKGVRTDKFIISPWLDHSMKLGKDYYRVRWILRLGDKYNRLSFWNDFAFWREGESETMYRIRKLIDKYKLTLR